MCIMLSVALVLSLALAGFLYTSKNVYIVRPKEKRVALRPVSAQVNFDIFARHFLSLYANYSPSTINHKNLNQAMKLSTKAFSRFFQLRTGTFLRRFRRQG